KTPPSHGGNRGSIPLSAATILKRIAQPGKVPKFFQIFLRISAFFLFTIWNGVLQWACLPPTLSPAEEYLR
ncbi:MAG: hypothetical protein NC517_08450, partial [Firmicutes bacterium]|nr:hypothetical protein [Bacillota bacterium]